MKTRLPSQKNLQGFTLIELLVAITIVAVMAAVGVVVFSSFQQRARDAKRSQDLEAIAGALEGKKTPGNIFYKGLRGDDFAGGSVPLDPKNATQKYCLWGKTDVPPTAPPTIAAGVVTSWLTCAGPAVAYTAVIGATVPADTSQVTSWTICAQKESEENVAECRYSKL